MGLHLFCFDIRVDDVPGTDGMHGDLAKQTVRVNSL
jgi:hypothetical protein